jgi:molybdopterin-guanine dinucleotide biosynthesis protein A
MGNNISGVILAGGNGKRFNGIIKTRILIDGKTIISRIIDTISDIFDEIIIVTNTPEEFSEFRNCKIINDQFLNKGPLGGIHSALKASEKEALFVFAGDMPLLDKEFIIRQIDYYCLNKCEVLIPRINKYIEPLHGIYKKTLISVLEEYLIVNHDCAVREFLKIVNAYYLQFEGSEKNRRAFMNINSPNDISVAEKLLRD